MARLINCSDCGNRISSNAYNCPRCGNKIRSTPINAITKGCFYVAAFFVILFIMIIVLFFATAPNIN